MKSMDSETHGDNKSAEVSASALKEALKVALLNFLKTSISNALKMVNYLAIWATVSIIFSGLYWAHIMISANTGEPIVIKLDPSSIYELEAEMTYKCGK